MKTRMKAVALLLVLVCLLSCLSVLSGGISADSGVTSTAPDEEVRYTKKIVSVLYDNSGSMTSGVASMSNPYDMSKGSRMDYAVYSMQMLMSLLGPDDELVMIPLNKPGSVSAINSTSYAVEIDLANPDRQKQINNALTASFLANTPQGGTPASSIKYAVDLLTARGLKDSQNLATADQHVEHWLVFLSDGVFDDGYNVVPTAPQVENNIADYPSLKTVFIGLGAGAPSESEFVSQTDSRKLSEKYQFTYYNAADATTIASVMQEVSNRLSGRYTLEKTDYTINGNTVTINLSGTKFSFKSVSLVAQNCDATLKKASYNGNDIEIDRSCIISPSDDLKSKMKMKNGVSAVINGSPYFSGGTLTFEFSSPVDPNSFSILAEPALNIVSYVEFYDKTDSTWKKTTEQQINENLTDGDKVRVGYDVFEMATGKPVDIKSIFDDTVESVSYANKNYKILEEITLVKGSNAIVTEVSVMEGAYTMSSTIRCIILDNPSEYTILVEADDRVSPATGTAKAVFTVIVDGNPITKKDFDKFTKEYKVTGPDGKEAEYEVSIGSDYKVHVTLKATKGLYGDYTVYFKAANEFGIYRDKTVSFNYQAPTWSVEAEGPDQAPSGSTQAVVKFIPKVNGVALKPSELQNYSYTVTATAPDGSDAGVKTSIGSDGSVSATVSIDPDAYGKYNVYFEIVDGSITADASHTISYKPASILVTGEHLNAMPKGEKESEFKYKVILNGSQLNREELSRYTFTVNVTSSDGRNIPLAYVVSEDGTVTAAFDGNEIRFGAYQIIALFTIYDDCSEDYTHEFSYFPEAMTVAPKGSDSISLSEHELSVNTDARLQFELKLDDKPFPFDDPQVIYKLYVGGVDVTQYATLEGDVLTYIPKTEHLGSEAQIGNKTVKLTVDYKDLPQLSTSATANLTVRTTLYVVEAVNLGNNKNIDRFYIEKSAAALYFKVLRDGKPLSADELNAALENGDIAVADVAGTFTWKFWLPVGHGVSVEEKDGTAYVAVKAKWTVFVPLMTMFIFDGEREIGLSYGEVSASDNFNFTKSPIFEYIWRILLIIFIVYTIFYIVGFFNGKCQSFTSGVLLRVQFGSDGGTPGINSIPINTTLWSSISWHVGRFFWPYSLIKYGKFLWYDQPVKSWMGIKVFVSENGDTSLNFGMTKSDVFKYSLSKVGKGGVAFKGMESAIIERPTKRPVLVGVTNSDVKKLFNNPKALKIDPKDPKKSEKCNVPIESTYGIKAADGTIGVAYVFVAI